MKGIGKFLAQTFRNALGQADGKLVTACLSMLTMLVCVLVFFLTGRALPDHMWYSFVSLVALGFGFDSLETVAARLRKAKPTTSALRTQGADP